MGLQRCSPASLSHWAIFTTTSFVITTSLKVDTAKGMIGFATSIITHCKHVENPLPEEQVVAKDKDTRKYSEYARQKYHSLC